MSTERKPNYFVRFLVLLFIAFLTFLVWTSFSQSKPIFSISSGIITVLFLITILILSEAFDNLSIGKLFSLNRQILKKEEEIKDTRKENSDLRENIIRLTSVIAQVQQQSTTNNNIFTPMSSVEKADRKAQDEDLEGEEQKNTEPTKAEPPEIDKGNIDGQTKKPTRPSRPVLANYTLNVFLKKYDINETDVFREVQFTTTISGSDPIMERQMIFDAYFKTPNKEVFIEVERNSGLPSIVFDRLYVRLAKILFYRQAKHISAELVLVLYDLPQEYQELGCNLPNSTDRFIKYFQPAIANGLLRVETISISTEEVDTIMKENNDSYQPRLF